MRTVDGFSMAALAQDAGKASMDHLPGVHAPFMVRVVRRSSGSAGRPIPAGEPVPEARAGQPRSADAADAPERLRGTPFRRLAPPPATRVVRAPSAAHRR